MFQLFAPFPQEVLLREELLLLRLDGQDVGGGLFQDHHLGGLLVVFQLGDLVAQREEAAFQLVPPLALQDVVRPPLVVLLRVRGPGAGAFAVVADLFEDTATVQLSPLGGGIVLPGGGGRRVIVLMGGHVAPLKDQRAVRRFAVASGRG